MDCLSVRAGSNPVITADNMARSSNGRMRGPHPRDTGSSPVRVTERLKEHSQVAEPVYARRSERRVRKDMRVRPSPWLLEHCRCDRCPIGFHTAGALGSIPRPATCCGWASAHSGLISLNGRVRPPDPRLTAEYANWQSGHVESVAILQVRLLPRSLFDPVVQW